MPKKFILGATILLVSTQAFSASIPDPTVPDDSLIQTGRYSSIANEPMYAQSNPLKVLIRSKIPTNVHTVEEAINFLLKRSGYSLASHSTMSKETKVLLGHPLPDVHRNIGPIALDKALKFLAGDSYRLVVDPIYRKVSYVPTLNLEAESNEQR